MSVLRAFRKRPPYPIPSVARDNLPCLPCITERGSHPTYFAEFAVALGPQGIGITGDNSFITLYGRVWGFLFCDDGTWHILQWVGSEDLEPATGLTSRGWAEVTDGLPTLPGLTPGAQARFSLAFDQSARVSLAYEEAGVTKITRWDAGMGAYVQNVDFAGVDPCLLIDASVTDPLGYPNLADDGWSVREAFFAGVPVLFEWLPEPAWRESAIPDSDVLCFYLTPDRLQVRCRVQRQLYQTEHVIHTFAAPVILDRVLALPGRYQLLISDAEGQPLADMLVSDPYLGDFIINPRPIDELAAAVAPEDVRVENDTYATEDDDELAATVEPEAIAVTGDTFPTTDDDALDAAVAPEDIEVIVSTFPTTDDDALDAAVAPETPIPVITTTVPTEDDDALDATVAPEAIRVQTV